jgi:signal transduction histidine kinase
METETFIADDTDNKELENLKNEWENLRIEVDKLKKMAWIYAILSLTSFCLLLYIIVDIFIITKNIDDTNKYTFFLIFSIGIAYFLLFKYSDLNSHFTTLTRSYQKLHQTTHKSYTKIPNNILTDEIIEYTNNKISYIARILAKFEKDGYPLPKIITNFFLVIYVISIIVIFIFFSAFSDSEKRKQEQTKFTNIENRIIILDNKLTKLQVQNDSLKVEIELLKKQVKK